MKTAVLLNRERYKVPLGKMSYNNLNIFYHSQDEPLQSLIISDFIIMIKL